MHEHSRPAKRKNNHMGTRTQQSAHRGQDSHSGFMMEEMPRLLCACSFVLASQYVSLKASTHILRRPNNEHAHNNQSVQGSVQGHMCSKVPQSAQQQNLL